jgi:hypothetical protein
MAAGPIEVKSYTATGTTLIVGYACAVLISAVPWLNQHLTPDQQQQLPWIITTAATALASYFAPHTHRPDLAPVTPEPRHALPPTQADTAGQS